MYREGPDLVPEDCEPLLEGQLEPVTAGDAVAGPVVEVLMADDTLDAAKVHVGGGLRGGQDQAGVEDIQRLVLHGTLQAASSLYAKQQNGAAVSKCSQVI